LIRRSLAVGAAMLVLAGCSQSGMRSAPRDRLEAYLAQVEPIRVAVNRLLDGADPILAAYGEHRLSTRVAQRRIDRRWGSGDASAGASTLASLRGIWVTSEKEGSPRLSTPVQLPHFGPRSAGPG
jgi:hypothetical protein